MRTKTKFMLGICLGLILGSCSIVFAQKLSRTTPVAGGPPQQGFLGDFDSGLNPVATGPTSLTANTVLIQNIYCHNATGTAATLTITNTAGTAYVQAQSIAPNTTVQLLNGGKGLQMVGIKVSTGTNNAINCQFSGYQ